uniref:Uncharacterized protein n=1 Tax=Anopheles christyi TaxID=43041 RepID=A0A182JS52_9DIPT
MGTQMVRINFNWIPEEGGVENHATSDIIATDEPNFGTLTELLRDDQCLVLTGPADPEPCEMQLTITPLYQVQAISIVVECPVIEIYYGRLREYNQTYHGTLVYKIDDGHIYRYDIRITTEINELHVKFIMDDLGEPICLYTTHLYLKRNTDPLRAIRMMMAEGRSINPDAVQRRLEGTNLSDRAEKCKDVIFSSIHSAQTNFENNNAPLTAATAAAQPTNIHVVGNTPQLSDAVAAPLPLDAINNARLLAAAAFMSPSNIHVANNNAQQLSTVAGVTPTNINIGVANGSNDPECGLDQTVCMTIEAVVKQYINMKFEQFEHFVDNRLAALEARQDLKLNRLLELLQEKKASTSNGSIDNQAKQ